MNLDVNKQELESILKHFHILTGIRIVLYDSRYQKIMAYPESNCRFCQRMKDDPETHLLCLESDHSSFEKCKKEQRLILYHCHAGLLEATAPLTDHGNVVGYMMFGQISDDPLSTYTPDIPLRSKEQIEAAAQIMEACTFYLVFKETVRIRRGNFETNMDRFLMQHLREDLSVEKITRELGISKTKLYDSCSLYFGHSIAKHILYLRMEKAKELLITTDLPITLVAEEVGFSDYNYFCRVFKKETGMPARKYRVSNAL